MSDEHVPTEPNRRRGNQAHDTTGGRQPPRREDVRTRSRSAGFTRAKIIDALRALGAELTQQEVHGQVFVVRGAAMALAYSTRRVTKDIDAIFEPKAIIYEAAAKVARERDLPEDWLNDAAKGFMPGADSERVPVPEIEGIEVSTASPQYLLAMKLMAMRFGEDDEDIEVLAEQADIGSTEEAFELLTRLYPALEPPPKTRFFLEEMFEGSEHARASE